ncbi:MAG: lytic transglycosylase domain-containing protein [Actinobacteria bacterium]|nr:MAG: lytic transglycosylase domain-containing protein [Actinomycetota bacterium]REK42207.1 MAG: lytic transglycosylase domain-containing protein [Actinomycetota bacterium]
MRSRRFSFLAGWAAVILLAVAGFAAFGTSSDTSADVDFEAASASLGHTTGTYAGLTFALFAEPLVTAAAADESGASETVEEDSQTVSDASTGTIASPSGWLSEVQVRALVTEYFTPEDVNTAVRIAWCESRFDPEALDLRTGAVGLFQHLPQYWEERADNAGFPGADPTDPEASTAAAAWAVYNGGGWDIFACRA